MNGRVGKGGISNPLALVFEASTYRASVAIVHGATVLNARDVLMGGAADDRLMPAAAEVLAESGVDLSDLTHVVCGGGPGSFTSLRIAAALAKGLTTFPGGPTLATVSSLLLVAAGAADRLLAGSYLVSIDALRGERYGMLVAVGSMESADAGTGGPTPRIQAASPVARLSIDALATWARDAGATLIGPGCDIDAWPAAQGLARVWESVENADPASWEPDYGRLAEAQVRRAALESALPRQAGQGRDVPVPAHGRRSVS